MVNLMVILMVILMVNLMLVNLVVIMTVILMDFLIVILMVIILSSTHDHPDIFRSLVSARRGLILGGAASVLGWSVILCAALVSEHEN